MKFNLASQKEVDEAFGYLTKLAGSHSLAEVVKVSPNRSLSQNAYLHLIITYFGVHFGYTAAEAKLLYKQINKDVYYYKKKDRVFIRSSADLTKEEMAKTIDNFMRVSAEQGCPLPLATDTEWLRSIDNEIEKARHYT